MAKNQLETIEGVEPTKAKPESKKGGKKTVKKKKKGKKNIALGIIRVQSTFNNTIVTITDTLGNTLAWSSAGTKGFKGARKSTPFAAQVAGEDAAQKAKEHGLKSATAFIKGPGAGREAALRAISSAGIRITRIQDITPIPHNGCRPPKKRRV